MKQIWKKARRAALLVLGMLLLCTACPVWAASGEGGIDEEMRTTLIGTAESLSQAIVELSQEEIDAYLESGDAFTLETMEAWERNRDELGEFKSLGEAVAETTTDGYSVRLPMNFSKRNAEMVYLFDQTGTPTSFSIDIQYPMSVLLQRAGMNTLLGMGIVFIMLIFLTLVISLFRYIGKAEDKTKKEDTELPVSAQAQAKPQLAAVQQDDQELIAVIAAAIAAYEGTSTDSFVVRSVRKANRRKEKW